MNATATPTYYSGNRPTVTDLFCGAGGSSEGAEWAGADVAVAANHWQTAIDVHQANHDDTRHDCADISQVDFRRYPATDILIGSPECTNHTNARGVSRKAQDATLFDQDFDPAAERSRATMWDMVRAAETQGMRGTPYKAIIVENVVEATNWVMWPAWLMAMVNPAKDVHYEHRVLSHNSMHHGVPQSRDRIYVVFWLKGLDPDLELELAAWCGRCDAWTVARQAFRPGRRVGKYRRQYHYCCVECHDRVETPHAPAASIIDWSLPMTRIRDRKRPLAKATMARIQSGLDKYGPHAFMHQAAGNVYQRPGSTCRSKGLDEPLGSQTTTVQHGVVDPGAGPPPVAPAEVDAAFITRNMGGMKDAAFMPTGLTEPFAAMTTKANQSLIVHLRNHGEAQPAIWPLNTVSASGNHHALVVPNNTNNVPTPVSEPTGTMTTGNRHGLLVPYYGKGQPTSTGEPSPTVTTRDRCALVEPPAIAKVDPLDCYFRMLDPAEVAAAMSFPDGYIPVEGYTKRDRVKLAGNAVTPPVMAWITGRIIQALEAAA